MGRPSKLNPALVEQVAAGVGMGLTLESAAGLAHVSARSLRRWREQGEAELVGLSDEAHFALALRRADDQARALSWRETAALLDQLAADRVDFDFDLD